MRLVISDTGQVNYLILIGQVEVLASLFEKVLMPRVVLAELLDEDAPREVRMFFREVPVWMEVADLPDLSTVADDSLSRLDDREKAAIILATAMKADLLLMDDREGVVAARRAGLAVTGTLGVLDMAAERGLVDLDQAFHRTEAYNVPLSRADLGSASGKARSDARGISEAPVQSEHR